jgi:hypothetical protein
MAASALFCSRCGASAPQRSEQQGTARAPDEAQRARKLMEAFERRLNTLKTIAWIGASVGALLGMIGLASSPSPAGNAINALSAGLCGIGIGAGMGCGQMSQLRPDILDRPSEAPRDPGVSSS